MTVAFYLRVSTLKGQTTGSQRLALDEVAARRGWADITVYEDAGVSGAVGRDQRPAFDRMMRDVTRGHVTLVAAWSVDRIGRSMADLVHFMQEINSLGCGLYLHQQALDTSTPGGRMMFQMIGVFSEYEREMIGERVRAGLARAVAAGTKLGRKPAARATEDRILALRSEGMGMLKIAKMLKVGTSVVQRVLASDRATIPGNVIADNVTW